MAPEELLSLPPAAAEEASEKRASEDQPLVLIEPIRKLARDRLLMIARPAPSVPQSQAERHASASRRERGRGAKPRPNGAERRHGEQP